MPFQIIRNDITKVKADVIVNTANPKPIIGGGTDSAIYRAAGEQQLLEKRRQIGNIARGQAVATPAFNLPAQYIIHTVGPAWVDGKHGEMDILRSCYANSLNLAHKLKAESIAFPLIATGVYGFPKDEALNIAMAEIGRFLLTHDMTVILVVFDPHALKLSEELVGGIEQFIDDHRVQELHKEEYLDERYGNRRRREEQRYAYEEEIRHRQAIREELIRARQSTPDAGPVPSADMMEPTITPAKGTTILPTKAEDLDSFVGGAGATFQQQLFKLIDASGMDDVTVYKKANIDRKVFSRIRCKQDYKPKKITALAFAIALELDLPTTVDLLGRAGIAFSPSDTFDLIMQFIIGKKVYDVFKINLALFKYGLPTLGAEE